MSEATAAEQPQANEVAAPRAELLSAGAMLRRAREASGLHVAALAVTMKVPVKKLEALENDRLDLLPDAVFVRALASSVCRTLKIDATPVLAKLPQTAPPKLDTEERGINAPFHASGEARQWTVPEFLTRPAVLAVLALLLAAVVLVLLPSSPQEAPKEKASAEPLAPLFPPADATPAVNAPAPASPAAGAGVAMAPLQPEVATPAAVPAAPVVSVAAPAAAPAAKSAAAIPANVAAPAVATTPVAVPVPAPAAPVPNAGIVNFHAKGTSWVEVRDANGVVQLRKTLFNGESVQSGGALPLVVVVGRADVTTVEVRGKPFSLSAISADNVARFEVK